MANQFISTCAWSVLTLGVLCGAANADPKQELRQAYIELFGGRPDRNLLSLLGQQFESMDFDGDGIEKDEIALVELQSKTNLRANYASHWLGYDLDGDMRISKSEVLTVLSRQEFRFRHSNSDAVAKQKMRDQLNKRIELMFLADKDGNGLVEKLELQLSQIGNSDEIDFKPGGKDPLGFAKALLKADPNSDGTITLLEAASLLGSSLQGVQEEAIRKVEAARVLGVPAKQIPCNPFDVAKNTELIFIGAYEGAAAPTVTIVGQEEETSAATLVIEDGNKPLTLLLTNQTPMIWKITGNTKRVQQVIVAGPVLGKSERHIAAGIVGIGKEKIQITGWHCVPSSYDLKDDKLEWVKESIRFSLGRVPDVLLGAYKVQDAQIPSGKGILDRVKKGFLGMRFLHGDKELAIDANGKRILVPYVDDRTKLTEDERELLDELPGGVIQLSPSEVVSLSRVEAYEVLPKIAGIQQLQREGKIVRSKKKYCQGWLVNSKIRFPSGMFGGYSKVFFVPNGIPKPEGKQGHSSVIFQDKKSFDRYTLCFI